MKKFIQKLHRRFHGVPADGLTISEALAQVHAALPRKPVCVQLTVWWHSPNCAEPSAPEFSVWSEEAHCHYTAPTLRGAVLKALDANKAREVTSAEALDRAVAQSSFTA